MFNKFNALLLQLLCFWIGLLPLVFGLGRWLAFLYRSSAATYQGRFFAIERLLCRMLSLHNVAPGDISSKGSGNSYHIVRTWFKLFSACLVIVIVATLGWEWWNATPSTMPVKSFSWYQQLFSLNRITQLEWRKLFNLALSYVTNTGFHYGTPAAIEHGWGRLLLLIPLGLVMAATGISLAVLLIESIWGRDRAGGVLPVYIIRTLCYLLVPLVLLLTPLFVNCSSQHDHYINYRFAFTTACSIVTASGYEPFLPATKSSADNHGQEQPSPHSRPKVLTPADQLLLIVQYYAVLLIPAGLVRLLNYYPNGRIVSRSLLWVMIILFSGEVMLVALSESGCNSQAGGLSWLSVPVATATSLGSSLVPLRTLSASSQLLATCNLLFSNLLWGSNGYGLINTICYLLVAFIWLELMVAKLTNLNSKTLTLAMIFWLMTLLVLPSVVALLLTLYQISITPVNHFGLHQLMPIFYYYLSMLQNNGSVITLAPVTGSLPLGAGTLCMLLGSCLTGWVATQLIQLLQQQASQIQTVKTKSLFLLVKSPPRVLMLLAFVIILNLPAIAPMLMLGASHVE